jgi:hypothetical protein
LTKHRRRPRSTRALRPDQMTRRRPSAFHSSEAGSSFECSVSSGSDAFGSCSGPGAATRPRPSPTSYTFAVRATDPSSNTDQSPATRASASTPPARGEPGRPPPGLAHLGLDAGHSPGRPGPPRGTPPRSPSGSTPAPAPPGRWPRPAARRATAPPAPIRSTRRRWPRAPTPRRPHSRTPAGNNGVERRQHLHRRTPSPRPTRRPRPRRPARWADGVGLDQRQLQRHRLGLRPEERRALGEAAGRRLLAGCDGQLSGRHGLVHLQRCGRRRRLRLLHPRLGQLEQLRAAPASADSETQLDTTPPETTIDSGPPARALTAGRPSRSTPASRARASAALSAPAPPPSAPVRAPAPATPRGRRSPTGLHLRGSGDRSARERGPDTPRRASVHDPDAAPGHPPAAAIPPRRS